LLFNGVLTFRQSISWIFAFKNMNQELIHVFEVGLLLLALGAFYLSPFELSVNEDEDDE
jgi:hypothetical protein